MNYLTTLFRSIIASPKHTHSATLDLCFIEPRLIVCAGPVNRVKSIYRHLAPELVSFLDENCFQWHIWNYADEHNQEKLGTRVTHHPFPDHEVPTFDIIIASVNELDRFLSLDQRNVAVVHCKNGKGRSGTIICAYMMFRSFLGGQYLSSEDAITNFTNQRMKKFAGLGVSILSQQRYLKYWEEYLGHLGRRGLSWYQGLAWDKNWEFRKARRNSSISANSYTISQTYIYGVKVIDPGYPSIASDIKIQTYIQGSIRDLHSFECDTIRTEASGVSIVPTVSIAIPTHSKDIRVCIKEWCYAWFNLDFETGTIQIRDSLPLMQLFLMAWDEVDGFKGTAIRGVKSFDRLEIYWYTAT